MKLTLKDALDIITEVKAAFPWMLKDIKNRADQLKPDDYSPELQHAIIVGEMLEEVS